MFAKEMIAYEFSVVGFIGLIFAVYGVIHNFSQDAFLVTREQWVPIPTPDHLNDIPAATAEVALELLDNLAVTPHRPIKSLQIAVNDKDQVV